MEASFVWDRVVRSLSDLLADRDELTLPVEGFVSQETVAQAVVVPLAAGVVVVVDVLFDDCGYRADGTLVLVNIYKLCAAISLGRP
jgi:hypothetical protein